MYEDDYDKCTAPSTVYIPKRSKGSTDDPLREMANKLRVQIQNALHADIMLGALHILGQTGYDANFKSSVEGNALKVSKSLMPDFYNLCMDVQRRLDFEDEVEYYIVGDSSINAFAISTPEGSERPHVIAIHSALYNIMNEEEMRFILGHEIGHLLAEDSDFKSLIDFVYNEDHPMPMVMFHKVRLVNQLAELMADRCGYNACGNLEACITAMYKLSSGLDIGKMGISINDLIRDNQEHLEYFLRDEGISRSTHPVNPIRIAAINLLASGSEQKINRGMRELLAALVDMGDSDFNRHFARFLVAAGYKAAMLDDGKITGEELDKIIENLSEKTMFATEFFQSMSRGDMEKNFVESRDYLAAFHPGLCGQMLEYVISVCMANKATTHEQLQFILDLGHDLGLTDGDIALQIAFYVRDSYNASIRE